MLKFRIHLSIWEGGRCKLGEVLENVKVVGFLYFWDILDKMKGNLGQECVKGASILLGQNRNNFPGQMTVFPVLALLFYL